MGELTFKAWLGSGSSLFATQQPYVYAAAVSLCTSVYVRYAVRALNSHFIGGVQHNVK